MDRNMRFGWDCRAGKFAFQEINQGEIVHRGFQFICTDDGAYNNTRIGTGVESKCCYDQVVEVSLESLENFFFYKN